VKGASMISTRILSYSFCFCNPKICDQAEGYNFSLSAGLTRVSGGLGCDRQSSWRGYRATSNDPQNNPLMAGPVYAGLATSLGGGVR
jgi:hypothetical protein